jgi:hypothetical protein
MADNPGMRRCNNSTFEKPEMASFSLAESAQPG